MSDLRQAAQQDQTESDLLTIAYMDGYAKGKVDALAKLAAAEMPEPFHYWEPDGTIDWLVKDGSGFSTNTGPAHGWKITNYYTEAQLREYGAACAAKVLSAEPVAWLFTNVQSGDMEASTEEDLYSSSYWHKQPLYTRSTT